MIQREQNSAAFAGSVARWSAAAAGLLLVALLSMAGWAWTQRAPGEGSSEVAFARAMTAHHEQAVEMSIALYNRTGDEELRQLVLDILLTQQAQIGQMQGWLAIWGRPLQGLEPAMADPQMMGMASQAEVNALRTMPVAEAEIAFLQLMIRHHQGGVMMAQMELAQINDPTVERLATAILTAQQSEIEYMEGLLAQRNVAAVTAR